MEKLELKHLAGYLSYGLKFTSELDKPYDEFGKQPIWKCNGVTLLFGDNCLNNVETSDAYPIHLCKPILRPLSDLTKEIEVNGEKFIPNHVLSNMTIGSRISADEMFRMLNSRETEAFPYWIIEKLLEWHFDIYGLIEKGLSIDKNTI